MEHIKEINLEKLVGVWTAIGCNCSMWISDDTTRIVIKYDNKPVISEPTNFTYDSVKNECRISESVDLIQVFHDGDICIRFKIGDQKIIRIQKKRE